MSDLFKAEAPSITAIGQLTGLTSLNISFCEKIPPSALLHLVKCTQLTALHLWVNNCGFFSPFPLGLEKSGNPIFSKPNGNGEKNIVLMYH